MSISYAWVDLTAEWKVPMQSLMLLNICLIIASVAVIFLGRTLRAKEEAAADFKDEEPASAKVLRKFISTCVWILLAVNLLSLVWLFASGTMAPPGTAPQVETTTQPQPADKAGAPGPSTTKETALPGPASSSSSSDPSSHKLHE